MSINFPLLLVLAVFICGALALFDLLAARMRRGRQVSRRQDPGRRTAAAGGR